MLMQHSFLMASYHQKFMWNNEVFREEIRTLEKCTLILIYLSSIVKTINHAWVLLIRISVVISCCLNSFKYLNCHSSHNCQDCLSCNSHHVVREMMLPLEGREESVWAARWMDHQQYEAVFKMPYRGKLKVSWKHCFPDFLQYLLNNSALQTESIESLAIGQ